MSMCVAVVEVNIVAGTCSLKCLVGLIQAYYLDDQLLNFITRDSGLLTSMKSTETDLTIR